MEGTTFSPLCRWMPQVVEDHRHLVASVPNQGANSSWPPQAVTSDVLNTFVVLVKPGSINPALELAQEGWF